MRPRRGLQDVFPLWRLGAVDQENPLDVWEGLVVDYSTIPIVFNRRELTMS